MMQPHFTPKQVGRVIYVLIETQGHREDQKFIQNHPASPGFDPLVPVTGNDDHFPAEHVTNVTGTRGSKI